MDKNTKQRKQMIRRMAKKTPDLADIWTMKVKDYKPRKTVRPEPKELNFLQAFIILVITLVLFTVIFPLAQRAMDIQAVHNCELRGDCSEVIRDINR